MIFSLACDAFSFFRFAVTELFPSSFLGFQFPFRPLRLMSAKRKPFRESEALKGGKHARRVDRKSRRYKNKMEWLGKKKESKKKDSDFQLKHNEGAAESICVTAGFFGKFVHPQP